MPEVHILGRSYVLAEAEGRASDSPQVARSGRLIQHTEITPAEILWACAERTLAADERDRPPTEENLPNRRRVAAYEAHLTRLEHELTAARVRVRAHASEARWQNADGL
jgi:hypothetical protein